MSTSLEPYNLDWPTQYVSILDTLERHLDGIEEIDYTHIGGTCIPGLPSRPVIDILVTVQSVTYTKARLALISAGYVASSRFPVTLGAVLVPPATDLQFAHAIYLCESNGLAARAHRAVLNLLISDAELRDEYRELKMKHPNHDQAEVQLDMHDEEALLSRPQENDQEAPESNSSYTSAKADFLQQALVLSSSFTEAEFLALFQTTAPHFWAPLTTNRLTLREYILSDIPGMYTLESNPMNARYQSWEPWTFAQARQNVARGIARSYGEKRDVIELAVVEKEGGDFVGRIGGRVQALSLPDGEGDAKAADDDDGAVSGSACPYVKIELWYSLLPSVQGRGYATEAMTSFISALALKEKARYAGCGEDVELELEIECDPRNTGSWRLAERLGFEKFSLTARAWECKGEWVDSLVYRRVV